MCDTRPSELSWHLSFNVNCSFNIHLTQLKSLSDNCWNDSVTSRSSSHVCDFSHFTSIKVLKSNNLGHLSKMILIILNIFWSHLLECWNYFCRLNYNCVVKSSEFKWTSFLVFIKASGWEELEKMTKENGDRVTGCSICLFTQKKCGLVNITKNKQLY